MAKASKNPPTGEEILRFLRSFEGAAATFGGSEERWTLWLPEITAGDHPLTPASQVFFPVILRHGPQAIAIRFLYDCSTGKMRYYTSAIPSEIASLPEFENAVSELFRHSLPVEPMRERKLGRGLAAKSRRQEPLVRPLPASRASLAEPAAESAALVPVPAPPPAAPAVPLEVAVKVAEAPRAVVRETRRSVRLEVGPRARSVLICLILAAMLVALAAIGISAYLDATQDPGVLHHKLELEQMRLQKGG